MTEPLWNFEAEPYDEPPDESARSLRSHLDRMPDAKMREYRREWSDEQVMEWDGNFRDDGMLMLVCCEREIDVPTYRNELEACLRYRDRLKQSVA
jgi:hypothetical protein